MRSGREGGGMSDGNAKFKKISHKIYLDDEARQKMAKKAGTWGSEKGKTIRVSPAFWRDSPNGPMARPRSLCRCDDMSSVEGG